MASMIFKVSLLLKNTLDKSNSQLIGSVRHASKRVGPGRNARPKHYGVWVQNGHKVTSGTTLARQFNLWFCAGLNVGYSRGHLYAKVPGKVLITTETTNFDLEHALVQKLSPDQPVLTKKYFNVIPQPQHNRFKLIDRN